MREAPKVSFPRPIVLHHVSDRPITLANALTTWLELLITTDGRRGMLPVPGPIPNSVTTTTSIQAGFRTDVHFRPAQVFAMRGELTGMVAEALVEQRHREALAQQTMPCPHCGRLLRARGTPNRTVETMVGNVSLARPYFYCTRCRKGFHPLDEALQLSERRKQWRMQKAAASLAVEVPYERASTLFGELTELSFSDHVAHEVVGEIAEGLTVLSVSPTAEEIGQRIAQVAKGRKWRPIVVLAIDGADVVLAENVHPFEDSPLRMNNPFGLVD